MDVEKLKEGIKSYNRYRKHLVEAELIETGETGFKVLYEGNFCRSCGMDEYFQDLIYELERLGLKSKLLDYERVEDDQYIVEYEIV